MPRSRGPDVAQKPLARGGLSQLRISSDSDPLQRCVRDRSPRPGSPKLSQSDPLNPKKLGTRIADLESQLGQAQVELKNLKGQLASAEAAKREAHEKLEKKVKKPVVLKKVEIEVNQQNKLNKVINDHQWETDVFEVPRRELPDEPRKEVVLPNEQRQKETKSVEETDDPPEISEAIKIPSHDLFLKDEEISSMKAMLEKKDSELKMFSEENELVKKQLVEAKADISSAQTKENEMASKLTLLGEELQASKAQTTILNEKLQSVERAKAGLESEMKQLRIQTEQWRKAADAAAEVLAGDVDMSGGCGKHFPRVVESPAGSYAGLVRSPGMGDDMGDALGSGKRKGSGMRMFGDLWKKKGHK